jgi:hypothetical protein
MEIFCYLLKIMPISDYAVQKGQNSITECKFGIFYKWYGNGSIPMKDEYQAIFQI